jgi:transposase
MARKGEKNINYPKEIKLKAVLMYLNGDAGQQAISRLLLGLNNNSSIRRWIKKYKLYGEEGLSKSRIVKPKKKLRLPKKFTSLEEENLMLKAENDYLKKLLSLNLGKIKKNKNL